MKRGMYPRKIPQGHQKDSKIFCASQPAGQGREMVVVVAKRPKSAAQGGSTRDAVGSRSGMMSVEETRCKGQLPFVEQGRVGSTCGCWLSELGCPSDIDCHHDLSYKTASVPNTFPRFSTVPLQCFLCPCLPPPPSFSPRSSRLPPSRAGLFSLLVTLHAFSASYQFSRSSYVLQLRVRTYSRPRSLGQHLAYTTPTVRSGFPSNTRLLRDGSRLLLLQAGIYREH